MDYFELTVDELFTEKTDLLQQLEDEKVRNCTYIECIACMYVYFVIILSQIKSQHHLDDLNLLLEKMKSTADNARDQSFAVDQTKSEFEVTYQHNLWLASSKSYTICLGIPSSS